MAKKEQNQTQKEQQIIKEVTVPIKWHVPDTMNSIYASNMLVQIMENEFKIMFFEMKPEFRLNVDEPLPTETRADCVASIILPPAKVLALKEALERQYEVYRQREQARQLKEKKDTRPNPNEPVQPS